MKKILNSIMTLALAGAAFTSCTDEVQFGNSFLDKAPGGSMNMDSIFNNPDYVNQFLTNIYNKQYYGLPYKHDGVNHHDHYTASLTPLPTSTRCTGPELVYGPDTTRVLLRLRMIH